MNIILKRLKRIAEDEKQEYHIRSIFDKKDDNQEMTQDDIMKLTFTNDNKKEAFNAFKKENPDITAEIKNKIGGLLEQCNIVQDAKKMYDNLTDFKVGKLHVKVNALKETLEMSWKCNEDVNFSLKTGKGNDVSAQLNWSF